MRIIFCNCFLREISEGLLKKTEELQTVVHSSENIYFTPYIWHMDFLSGSTFKKKKKSTCNAGDCLQWRRCEFWSLNREEPLEKEIAIYSCLGNPVDRGAWQVTVHGVARVGHNFAIKRPPPLPYGIFSARNCQENKVWLMACLSNHHPSWFLQVSKSCSCYFVSHHGNTS